jgi:spermidine synthase
MRALPFVVTIFLSAFLLFQVQPLISRYILPWFGGSPGVWSVAILFFQAVLLAGYAYAHVSISRFRPLVQLLVHLILLAAALALLPIIPPEAFKPAGGEEPTLRILGLLAVTVGLPYFALAATGPLLQAWFARGNPGRSPYALYALSNVGSLLALLSYPFVIEPLWGRYEQAVHWSWMFGVFAAACAGSALFAYLARPQRRREPGGVTDAEPPREPPPAAPTRAATALWIAFPAAGTLLLLSFTNQLCMDVASVPFLWVLPLSLYLLSFIVTFAGERWYPRGLWAVLGVVALGATIYASARVADLSLPWAIVLYSLALFIFCVICHGETYRLRPPAPQLTRFYLCISLGGVLGGAFVALLSPLLFSSFLEFPLGLMAVGTLFALAVARDSRSPLYHWRPRWIWTLLLSAGLATTAIAGYEMQRDMRDTIRATRNFYGVFRVEETSILPDGPPLRRLISGTTNHGQQFTAPSEQGIPTTYYGRHSGVGITIMALQYRPRMKVGVVGLGTGTLAAYARPNDVYRFYEINPGVERLAREYFFYLANCEAQLDQGRLEVVIADARLALEREEDQRYDVLVLDAFSSDAIPVHLLTLEAFETYDRHLKPNGVLCVHISNRHLDLLPVCVRAAEHLQMKFRTRHAGANDGTGATGAEWVLMTRDRAFEQRFDQLAEALEDSEARQDRLKHYYPHFGTDRGEPRLREDFRAWTDDYSNLFAVLR